MKEYKVKEVWTSLDMEEELNKASSEGWYPRKIIKKHNSFLIIFEREKNPSRRVE